jgi:hypothetical protein
MFQPRVAPTTSSRLKLRKEEIPIIENNPKIKSRLKESLTIMFDFWGFGIDFDTRKVTKKKSHSKRYKDEKFDPWKNFFTNDHNALRVTRMIKHVSNPTWGVCYPEFKGIMENFVKCLRHELVNGDWSKRNKKGLDNFKMSFDHFWREYLPKEAKARIQPIDDKEAEKGEKRRLDSEKKRGSKLRRSRRLMGY